MMRATIATRKKLFCIGIAILSSGANSLELSALAKVHETSRSKHDQHYIAQMSYKGYLSCRGGRKAQCDSQLRRHKRSMKSICYAVWTGDFDELVERKGGSITPYQMSIYRNWCNTASQEVKHANREYPGLLNFVSTYRDYKPDMGGDLQYGIKAYADAVKFQLKCSAGTVKRAAEAVELWGTRENGEWEVSSLQDLSPTRYREISTACQKNSWMRALIVDMEADLEANWPKISSSFLGLEACSKDNNAWSNEKQDNEESTLINLRSSYKALEQLRESSNSGAISSVSSSQISIVISDLDGKIKGCEISVATGKESLIAQEKEKERINRQKLHQEQIQAQDEASRRAAAQQRAAEAQRQAQKRAAEAERVRRLQQQQQDAIDSVILE